MGDPSSPSQGGNTARNQAQDQPAGPVRWLVRTAFNPDNFANFLIMLFTCALTIVGVLEYFLLRRSTNESAAATALAKQSADAATVSAKAGIAALTLASQNQRLEYQPYLDFGEVEIIGEPHVFGGELQVSARCAVKNIGKTPVRHLCLEVIYEVSWASTDGFSNPDLNHERLHVRGDLSLRVLAAGESGHLTGIFHTATIPQLREAPEVVFNPSGTTVWFQALFWYADVFSGETRLKRGRAHGTAHHYSGLPAQLGMRPNPSPLSVQMFPPELHTKG